jgi:alpha/beta superfamily hydrolase
MKKLFTLALSVLLLTSISAQAETTRLTIDGSKGKLSAIIQKPATAPGEKIPMVILMHGFMGNKGGFAERATLFDVIADKLEAQGIATLRFDFNGHGESEGEFWQMTVPNEIEDALKVYEYVRDLRYVSTVSVLGHSQGGVVASMVAGKLGAEIKSAVLMAPAAVLRDDAIRGSTMGATYDPLNLEGDWIEMFGGRVKLGTEYIRTAFNLPIYETAVNYKGALCVIHGTGDKVVPYTYGIRYTEQSNNAELYILHGEDHGFMKDMERATDIAVEFLSRNLVR